MTAPELPADDQHVTAVADADDGTAATCTCKCKAWSRTVRIGDTWAGRQVGTIAHARRAAQAAGMWHRIVSAQIATE